MYSRPQTELTSTTSNLEHSFIAQVNGPKHLVCPDRKIYSSAPESTFLADLE
jgi:hypothetical protein